VAVNEAEDALRSYKTDSERQTELTFDYVPPSVLEEIENSEKNFEKQKIPKIAKTKRKSLLPPPQILTPLDKLEYRESSSAAFDPDLAIPNERFCDSNSNKFIRPELITGEGN